jgi:hypothetical protein
MNDPRDLFAAYLAGELDAERVAELEAWLRAEPGRAADFMREAMFDCHIKALFREQNLMHFTVDLNDDSQFGELLGQLDAPGEALPLVDLSEHLQRQAARRRAQMSERSALDAETRPGLGHAKLVLVPHPLLYGLTAAVLAIVFALGYFVLRPAPAPQRADVAEPPAASSIDRPAVAELTRAIDARWARRHHSARPGDRLRVGDRYTLERGVAEIQTDRGAVVLIQGPCEIEFVGDNNIKLGYGKLIGRCPTDASKGLIVDTPNTRVIDVGTEFGVLAERIGVTTVEVFAGSVSVRPGGEPGREPVLVAQGQTANSAAGRVVVTDSDSQESRFTNRRLFERRDRWLAYRDRLMRDPSLLAYYSFDEPTGGRLIEARGEDTFDGAIHGARWSAGRFPWKRGLRFDGPGSMDHVALSAEASEQMNFAGSFSVAVWFKAEPFTSDWQSLITKGEAHWRLARNTMWEDHPQAGSDDYEPDALNFGYDSLQGDNPPDLAGQTAVDDGRWHLATIVFRATADGRGVKHLYIDGVADAPPVTVNEKTIAPDASRVWIAGNSMRSFKREFEGVIDEVAIFDRALTAEEIKRLYREGAPLN